MHGKLLVIAGSDSGGGAGIQADIKTLNNLNCFVTTAITAITVQNSTALQEVFPIPNEYISKQILCILEDFNIDVIKIGMLYDLNIMSNVYETLIANAPNIPVIFDPIWYSSVGQEILKMNQSSLNYLKSKFIPYSYIITPNIAEAEKICGINISNLDDMVIAAQILQNMGAKNILLTGGDAKADIIHDILLTDKLLKIYESEKINTLNTHGSGCSLASAVAANIAHKIPIEESVAKARNYVYNAIRRSIKPGKGNGTLNHLPISA